jgi:hypothetical protein
MEDALSLLNKCVSELLWLPGRFCVQPEEPTDVYLYREILSRGCK